MPIPIIQRNSQNFANLSRPSEKIKVEFAKCTNVHYAARFHTKNIQLDTAQVCRSQGVDFRPLVAETTQAVWLFSCSSGNSSVRASSWSWSDFIVWDPLLMFCPGFVFSSEFFFARAVSPLHHLETWPCQPIFIGPGFLLTTVILFSFICFTVLLSCSSFCLVSSFSTGFATTPQPLMRHRWRAMFISRSFTSLAFSI